MVAKRKTCDEWLAEARELRNAAQVAELKLLQFLVDFEGRGPWQDAGATTFDGLLHMHRLCRPDRYRNFRRAHDMFGEQVDRMGVNAAVNAVQIKNKAKRSMYVQAAIAKMEEDGFGYSSQHALNQRNALEPDPDYMPRSITAARTMKQKLAEAEVTIGKLQLRIRELEAELRKKTKTG